MLVLIVVGAISGYAAYHYIYRKVTALEKSPLPEMPSNVQDNPLFRALASNPPTPTPIPLPAKYRAVPCTSFTTVSEIGRSLFDYSWPDFPKDVGAREDALTRSCTYSGVDAFVTLKLFGSNASISAQFVQQKEPFGYKQVSTDPLILLRVDTVQQYYEGAFFGPDFYGTFMLGLNNDFDELSGYPPTQKHLDLIQDLVSKIYGRLAALP